MTPPYPEVGAGVWWCPFGDAIGFKGTIVKYTRRRIHLMVDMGGPSGFLQSLTLRYNEVRGRVRLRR